MARKAIIQLTSDKTGEALNGNAESVALTIDGKVYDLDLTDKEAAELREFVARFTAYAQPVKTNSGSAGRKSSAGATDKGENARIREWAISNGMTVAPRGRISADIRERYYAAQRSTAVPVAAQAAPAATFSAPEEAAAPRKRQTKAA